MLDPNTPAVILAPMEGLTDAPMRALQGEIGAFTFSVSEFMRISESVPSYRVFHRHVPELLTGGVTGSGLNVAVQLLGGHAGRMAQSAMVAVNAGARAIDINFGCPAPTVNRHDGGATLLKHPQRIREIVSTIRSAVPIEVPVSAKLRLGWDCIDAIFENAAMAAEGGASWITIHARTRTQGYRPPAYWCNIGLVRERLGIPVVANGDIWTIDEFRRCRDETGCIHFMLGRPVLANPLLSHQISWELGITTEVPPLEFDWVPAMRRFVELSEAFGMASPKLIAGRLKQWLKIAHLRGAFAGFERVKTAATPEEIISMVGAASTRHGDT
jgi:tRNA-dihydrouridine synthase C